MRINHTDKKSLLIVSIALITLIVGFYLITSFPRIKTVDGYGSVSPPVEHHSPPTAVIEQGSGVEAASYIIFKDDEGFVYAKNGSTGALDYSGTNASQIIQNSIDALSSGGRVFIKNGTYSLTTTLTIPYDHITLQGTGWNTILKQEDNTNLDILINVTGEKFVIKNLEVDGNKNQQSGGDGIGIKLDTDVLGNWHRIEYVYLHGTYGIGIYGIADYLRVLYCDIRNTGSHGIFMNASIQDFFWLDNTEIIYSAGNGVYILGQGFNWIFNSKLSLSSDGAGLVIEKSPSASANRENRVIGNEIAMNHQGGIRLIGATKNIILGNTIRDNSRFNTGIYNDIQIEPSGTVHSTYNIIESNDFKVRTSSNRPKYHIYENDTNQDYNLIKGNLFDGADTTALYIQGSNTKVEGNLGFTTENGGTASVANNDWFTHGLDTTPTIVILTPTTYNMTAYKMNWNSTHIQVGLYYTTTGTNVTSATNVTWYAEV